MKARSGRSVSTDTFTSTIHHVEVDLTGVLAEFDPTDQVVVIIRTPSGRPKRVAIPSHLFVSPLPTEWDR